MKIYEMQIIDLFLGCFSLKDIEKSEIDMVGFDFEEFEREFIYRLAKETYWEGDGEVLFFPIIANRSDGRLEYGAIIKQQNNGSTWVAIPSYIDGSVIHGVDKSELVTDTKEYKKWYQKQSSEPWNA